MIAENSPAIRVNQGGISFVRFIGGAIAPWLAGMLAEWFAPQVPFYVGAGAVVLSILVLFSGRAVMRHF